MIFFLFIFSIFYINCSLSQSESCSYPKVEISFKGDLVPDEFLPGTGEPGNSELDLRRIFFLCLHDKPVKWVTDIRPESALQLGRNFNLRRNATSYLSYFVLFFRQREFRKYGIVLLSCQPFDGRPETATFMRLVPTKYNIDHYVIPRSNYSEACSHLPQPITRTSQSDDNNTCDILLVAKFVAEGVIVYKFVANSSIKFTAFGIGRNRPIEFHNLLGQIKHINPSCVNNLPHDSNCDGCLKLKRSGNDGYILQAAIDGGKETVFRGLFGLVSGTFYSFSAFPEEEKSILLLEDKRNLYANKTFEAKCLFSPYFYSYGGVIILLEETVGERDPFKGQTVTYTENGSVLISRNITIHEPSVTTISCMLPLLGADGYFDNSELITVKEPIPPTIFAWDEGFDSSILSEGAPNYTLSCEAFGDPSPNVEWVLPHASLSSEIIHEKESGVDGNLTTFRYRITIPHFTQKFSGTYSCIASNFFGSSFLTYAIKLPSGLPFHVKLMLSLILSSFGLILSTVVAFLYRRMKERQKLYREETEKAIREFKEGSGLGTGRNKGSTIVAEEKEINATVLDQPYNAAYEVEFEFWRIGDRILGSGNYGLVREGSVTIGGKTSQIAIKTLKESADLEEFKNFLKELKIMAYIGSHPNVVSLVAACTENISSRNVMLGVELCPNGSLSDFLTNRRGAIYISSHERYSNLPNLVTITELDLYVWAFQIAQGMEFLASKLVLHSDLAARNVLLAADKTAKISDFGLSRVLTEQSNYTKKSKVALPWKHMAPESLKGLKFSTASDVWSYGVTLWEVFSLGDAPFPGVIFCTEFIDELEQGYRLPKPKKVSEDVYQIMLTCWAFDPLLRPSFTQLKFCFSQILEGFSHTRSSLVEWGVNLGSLRTPETPVLTTRGNRITTANSRQEDSRVRSLDQLYANIHHQGHGGNENLYLNV